MGSEGAKPSATSCNSAITARASSRASSAGETHFFHAAAASRRSASRCNSSAHATKSARLSGRGCARKTAPFPLSCVVTCFHGRALRERRQPRLSRATALVTSQPGAG